MPKQDTQIVTSVLATNPECARAAKRAGVCDIYVPALNYRRGTGIMAGVVAEESQIGYPKQSKLILPTVLHDEVGPSLENKHQFNIEHIVAGAHHLFADSISSVEIALQAHLPFEVGPHVPVLNSASANYFAALGCQCIWLSPELSLTQIKALISQSHDVEFGIFVIGAQELMITEHCELMSLDVVRDGRVFESEKGCAQNCKECPRRQSPHYLLDRKGYEFPVVTDVLGRSHIYNSIQSDVCHALPQLIEAGVSRFMVDTTLMTIEQAAQATGRLVSSVNLAEAGKIIDKPKNTTTGHLFREVM